MPDHKLQPGGKLSRDPSPRPVMTTQLERQRDGEQEENQRKESNTVKMRDKTRHREIERTMGGYYKRERAPAPRLREEEREWRERVRRQEERIRNGRMSSNLEEREQHAESGNRKGDTFPRMRKGVAEYDRRIISTTERGDRRERERPQRAETDKWERERERDRTWYGERERGEIRSRPKEEGKSMGRRQDEHIHQKEKYQDYDAVFQERRREMAESWHDGERDTARKRDKPKSNIRDREARIPSPHRRREREAYPDRREREKAHRREGKRDTRSEGDSVERELKRERVRDREREELRYQHSKSEGDTEGNSAREADRRRERDGQRDSDREGYISRRPGGEKDRHREDVRRADREGDRRRERDFRDDRREDDRYRERRERDRRERDVNYRPAPKQPPSSSGGERNSDMESDARYQRDSYETQLRREGERHREERRDPEKGAERSERREKQHRDRIELPCNDAEQRRMWLDPRRGKTSKEEIVDQEGHRERKEEVRIKEEPDDMFLEQSHHERQTGRDKYRRDIGRETQEESVDKEEVGEILGERDKAAKEHLSDSDGGIKGSWQRGAEGKNVTDSTEESDREEEGGGDYWARSESEGGSEGGWNQDRERMLSGEDGFVTVSSGGDEEDYEKESDDEFKDCQEFWNPGYTYKDRSPVGSKGHEADEQTTEWTMTREENVDEGDDEEEQEREKRQKYVFCVIGQTLPRSGVKPNNPKPEDDHHDSEDAKQQSDDEDDVHLTLSRDEHPVASSVDTEREHHAPREDMLTSVEPAEGHSGYSPKLPDANITEEMRSTVDTPPGSMNRDSQTERLLKEWREKNKELGELKTSPVSGNPYDVVYSPVNIEQIQPLLDQINSGAMSPEEVEAIRIRISGAWSMSDEPKRHSQAPHLKWAKNVVREILGHSDEHAVDETNTEAQEDQGIKQSEAKDNKQDEAAQATEELPVFKVTAGEQDSEPELDDEELGEEPRGMGQSQAVMHADQSTAMHVVTSTHTHDDTLLDTEREEDDGTDKRTARPGRDQLAEEGAGERMGEDGSNEVKLTESEEGREEEVKMLSVSKMLYKPNSCPILNYQSESELLSPSREGDGKELHGGLEDSEDERQGEAFENRDAEQEAGRMTVGEQMDVDKGEGKVAADLKTGTLASSCSFRDLGPEARLRRRGIRKTTERRNEEIVQEEEEGVGRDRRTRIFPPSDDGDDQSKSWGEVELRNVLETINRQKRNSRFFNAAQLYQQYSEEAQNFEILRQSRSDTLSVSEDNTASPAPSPPPARRPLPPLPPVPNVLTHAGSVTSIQSLPLPEPPRSGGRPPSPRLSISLRQSASLWRDLPAVRNSAELEELTDDQRRLQEVRFEVVTSEASYCHSLDIVVEHFVKSKQLGSLLTTQDRNWLFSRLADVRAISHSFLSKLEERVESDMMHFTVCDIIARNCPRFKMVYVPYLTNQSYQDATYQRLMNENPGFKRIVEKLERSPVCQRLPLRSFLVLPFQRITRIKLLVQNIVKRTTPGTPEATHAIKALKLVEKLIQESNDSITQMKSIESLVSLNAKVDFACRTLPLISQSRRLVREGPVTELMDFSLKETERNVYMHLFNDYLLLSLQKEGGRFTVIDHAPVSDLRAENCRVKLHSLQKNLFRLHMTNKALLLRTDTQSDKLRWISALSRPHPEIDFSAAQDFEQMQCIRAFVAQQPDELSLEKADVILVHQQSSDNWVEGTRLSDRHRGWVPKSHLETISNPRVRQRNLSDALKLTTATAAV
ncbi:trichohyalin isoform X1 [Salarias fasciatus]|uniref:Trichohyalin-like n=1 Tax=Salarias fasciatus TaxID=181472 RepID=A0A672FTY5_SALFA|nr:trichohyalin-like isoform X1 [Salarias fasciatus]